MLLEQATAQTWLLCLGVVSIGFYRLEHSESALFSQGSDSKGLFNSEFRFTGDSPSMKAFEAGLRSGTGLS